MGRGWRLNDVGVLGHWFSVCEVDSSSCLAPAIMFWLCSFLTWYDLAVNEFLFGENYLQFVWFGLFDSHSTVYGDMMMIDICFAFCLAFHI